MGTSLRESGTSVAPKKQIFNGVARMTAKPLLIILQNRLWKNGLECRPGCILNAGAALRQLYNLECE